MYDYLVDHALKNVWCTPDQDLQAVVQPARLTPVLGAFNKVQILWRQHALPVANTRFHVYQVGQLHPLLMGLFPIEQTWKTMAEACGLQNLMVDIYANSGVQFPRCEVWYMVTADRNLVIAVKAQERIPVDLAAENLYVRVYTNAYFHTLRADGVNDVIVVKGDTCLDTTEIMALQTQYLAHKAKPGLTSAYVNGFLVDQIDLITVKPGDVAEFVYDSSVKRVVDFTVGDLDTFPSTLDAKHKYLLHYAGPGEGTIDYQDDVDLFVIKKGTGIRYSGVYYHRNTEDAVRMVTHKDYAIPTPYIVGYADDNGWNDVEALQVRLVVRKAGWLRPLVNEDNRIKELYKLDDTSIVRSFLGLDSVLENWTAPFLENAWYTKLMGLDVDAVTGAVVENTYGYNAISSLIADTPRFTRTFSGQQVVDVPYGLQTRATGYEYDAAGHLLGWFTHLSGSIYPARDITARLVEMIAGDVADRLDEYYGDKNVILEAKSNYRMYKCPMEFGVPSNDWVDVTGGGEYVIIGNKLTWLLDQTEWYTCVRSDRTNLGYSLELSAADGVLKFSLNHRQLRFGSVQNYVMQIPMGELDLWLNGRSLVEGLDYVVKFPQIVVLNKEYLVNPRTQLQKIDIRCSGFCRSDLTREPIEDVGFVRYGQLSHNNRFDIRDDKVMRIVVDGALYHRSELQFSEDNPAVVPLDARNGSPYVLRDIVVPMRGFTDQGTYEMRTHSQEIDQKVADYMTLKFPDVDPETPSVIPARYAIYSPFFNKIMRDLVSGALTDPRLKLHYNDMVVRELCAPYLWLLEYDATQEANALDDNFVNIHPHNEPNVVAIDIYYYKFLTRVVKIYLNDKVEMSHFISLAPAT